MLGTVIRNAAVLTGALTLVAIVLRDHAGLMTEGAPATSALGAKPPPRSAPAAPDGRLAITAGPDGHYRVAVTVNGQEIRMLVDTGATVVALSRDDAERIGFAVHQLDYSGRARTANGTAPLAPVTLDEVAIGRLAVRDVPAAVIDAPLEMSLLGMSFLDRLTGFAIENGSLVLRQ